MYYFEYESSNGAYTRIDNITKAEAKRLYEETLSRDDFLWAAWDAM